MHHQMKIAQHGSYAGVLSIVNQHSAFCVVVDAGMSYPDQSAIGALLTKAFRRMPPEAPNDTWPRRLAGELDDELKQLPRDRTSPLFLFYAACLISSNTVVVCTAGDTRVHLLQNEVLREVTRDHVLTTEDQGYVEQFYKGINQSDHPNLPTRVVGGNNVGKPPPEDYTWVMERPFAVLFATSQHHGGRSPESYLERIKEVPSGAPAYSDGGLVARIDCT
jgi:serine/threonine protein phosphatase PrpC